MKDHDPILESALDEALGGKAPPDLIASTLARVNAAQPAAGQSVAGPRPPWRAWGTGLAAAAIVVISAVDDPALLRELERSGIHRFVSKSAKPAEIIESIRQVFHVAGPARRDAAQRSPEEGKRVALSQRQLEVLQEMATGKSNKEIARSLDIAVDTVRAHVVEILSRLGVRNRTEAVTVYYSGQYEVSK